MVRRWFCEVKPPQKLSFGIIRWVVIYPWAGLGTIFAYEYFTERDALIKIASEIESEEAATAYLASDLSSDYPDLPAPLTLEEKEQFRSKCIQEGIAPMHFNEFVKKLETQLSVKMIVRDQCMDSRSDACVEYVRLAKLLSG